jgi:FkbM family methyltransferase
VDGLTFLTPNSHCAWRVQTLYTKEPDTIAWLNRMQPGEVLFDVGANMGQYSLLAAQRGVRVHAFEPESQNFALLVRNIIVNNLSDMVTAWPVALSDHVSLDILHLSSLLAGGSCHAYGESIDFHGKPRAFPHRQGSVATTLDHFVAKYGPAQYIKLDVDGFEHLVVKGGALAVKRAKSVLIEINTQYPEHMQLVDRMCNEFEFNYDAAQAEESRRKEGPFTGVGNIIFYKD